MNNDEILEKEAAAAAGSDAGLTSASGNVSAQLETLIALQRKTLRQSRIRTLIFSVILVCILIAGFFMMNKIQRLMVVVDELQVSLETATEVVETVQSKLNVIDMTEINKAVASLTDAADTLGELNMEDFNAGITSFSGAVTKFEEIDIDSLNDLVSSLSTVTAGLESATNALTSIFKR